MKAMIQVLTRLKKICIQLWSTLGAGLCNALSAEKEWKSSDFPWTRFSYAINHWNPEKRLLIRVALERGPVGSRSVSAEPWKWKFAESEISTQMAWVKCSFKQLNAFALSYKLLLQAITIISPCQVIHPSLLFPTKQNQQVGWFQLESWSHHNLWPMVETWSTGGKKDISRNL